MRLRNSQFQQIDTGIRASQLRQIVQTYIREIRGVDARLAQALATKPRETTLEYFRKVYDLTKDRLYQKALLAMWAASNVDVFSHPDFEYIRDHTLLTGEAKARHMVLSFQVCVVMGGGR